MRVCLYERSAHWLEPLTLTRPIFELRCGMTALAEKQLRTFWPSEWGVLVRPELEALYRRRHPSWPINDADWLKRDATVLVDGRWLPPEERPDVAFPSVGVVDGHIVYAALTPDWLARLETMELELFLAQADADLPHCEAGGSRIVYPWDCVEHNAEQIRRDFDVWPGDGRRSTSESAVQLVGPKERLWVDVSARVEPYVMADTTNGPVVVDADAVLGAFTRLEGPCYIGPATRVSGAKICAGTSIGPNCRIGGEIEASIIHGHSNKHHEGFLGHSYVGEWVNLGAGTHNSDLRNDYGPVAVTIAGQRVDTGLTKVGCFLGDHTKTGLGTLLNTGTAIGAFCNLLPAGRLAPKYVPSFCNWWNGSIAEGFAFDQLMHTARQVMQRRGQVLGDGDVDFYERLWHETAGERRRVQRESEQRRLGRSA